MNRIRERLKSLRTEMAAYGVTACYIPTDDFHMSEYVGDYFKCRAYLSGFTGSAGTLVVLPDQAALWVDSRYFLQAADQLAGSGITMMKLGVEGQPSVFEYLLEYLKAGDVLALDGRTVPASFGQELERKLKEKEISLRRDLDLPGTIWPDRPPLPASRVWILEEAYSGKSTAQKLKDLRTQMKEAGADLHVLASLDDIAWLLNLRAADIAYNPVLLSYAVIGMDRAVLFANEAGMDAQVKQYLAENGFVRRPYHEAYAFCESLSDRRILLCKAKLNDALVHSLSGRGNELLDRENPTMLAKAVKNDTEIRNLREAHRKDGLAVSRFMHWLKTHVADGGLTECSAAAYLDRLRLQTEGNLGLSFPTICGYAAHGAIVHYEATEETDIPLEPKGLLLVDSGGQYLQGTTDITRTFALGPLKPEEKRDFTLVLKGMLNLASAKFPRGTTGLHLDAAARIPLWQYGLNFGHGTGHGVGYLLNVHESPNNISPAIRSGRQPVAFVPGMVTTDEPGLYVEGSHGIRTENELLCVESGESEYGTFYEFEVLTLAPIDLDAVDPACLNEEDIRRLNRYHKMVYERLAPYMTKDEQIWLAEYTRELSG